MRLRAPIRCRRQARAADCSSLGRAHRTVSCAIQTPLRARRHRARVGALFMFWLAGVRCSSAGVELPSKLAGEQSGRARAHAPCAPVPQLEKCACERRMFPARAARERLADAPVSAAGLARPPSPEHGGSQPARSSEQRWLSARRPLARNCASA